MEAPNMLLHFSSPLRREEKWGMGEEKTTKYKFPAGKGGREGKSPMGELKREVSTTNN